MATRVPVPGEGGGGDSSPSAGGAAATPDCVGESGGVGKGTKSQSAPPHPLPPPLDGVRGAAATEGESLEGREGGHLDLQSGFSFLLMRILHFGFPSELSPPLSVCGWKSLLALYFYRHYHGNRVLFLLTQSPQSKVPLTSSSLPLSQTLPDRIDGQMVPRQEDHNRKWRFSLECFVGSPQLLPLPPSPQSLWPVWDISASSISDQ